MFDDPWPDEPDEYDPEERWGDPERGLPGVPEAPGTRDTSASAGEIDSDVAGAFWTAVVLANAGLFAVSLGPMLVFFRGQWLFGGGLFVFGLLALARTYQHVRAFQTRDRGDDAREARDDVGDTREGRDDDATDDDDAAPDADGSRNG